MYRSTAGVAALKLSEETMINGGTKGLVITISGPHGSGKSTYAKALAEALHLRYISAGELFRELAREQKLSLEALSARAARDPSIDRMLDERTKAEAERGDVVIDAQLAAWILKDEADVKLLLVASDSVRFNRIAQRDHVTFEFAKNETLAREEIQRLRYKNYYGIDVSDLRIYDLRIDTGIHSIKVTRKNILDGVRILLQERETVKST